MGNQAPQRPPDGFEEMEFDDSKVFQVKVEFCGA